MKTGGSGSGRGSDVIIAAERAAIIIAVKKFERAFQELSFESDQSSVALSVNKLSVIENLMLGTSLSLSLSLSLSSHPILSYP